MSGLEPWQTLAVGTPLSMPDLALDGNLTGVIVAPRLIPLSRWLATLLVEEYPILQGTAHFRADGAAIIAWHAPLADEIDRQLRGVGAQS
jgi:uncharacterized protein